MSDALMILLTGVLFMALFNLLSYLRREGISRRFLVEGAAITALFTLLPGVFGVTVHPIAFLAIVYLLTLRVRLFIDLGSAIARRGNLTLAGKIFDFAGKLLPDPAGALMVRLNQGACVLQRGAPEDAIPVLQSVLEKAEESRLGIKHRAACHFNLGMAFWKKNRESDAEREFGAVQDLLPASPYARKAEKAVEKIRSETGTDADGDAK
jgi:hypothetical protein